MGRIIYNICNKFITYSTCFGTCMRNLWAGSPMAKPAEAVVISTLVGGKHRKIRAVPGSLCHKPHMYPMVVLWVCG